MKVRKWIKIFILYCVLIAIKGFEPLPKLPSGGPCENLRPGDCDPDVCNGDENSCEARYTRFWDPAVNGDRQRKSCQCAEVFFTCIWQAKIFTFRNLFAASLECTRFRAVDLTCHSEVMVKNLSVNGQCHQVKNKKGANI